MRDISTKVAKSHQQLVLAGKKRMAHLEFHFRRPDILGALPLASQMFQQSGKRSKNFLVIFSDMRQDTSELNLENRTEFRPDFLVAGLEQKGMVTCLQRTNVFLGADNAGKSVVYWNSLRRFWLTYFKKSQATVRIYSTLRDPSSYFVATQ